MPVLYYHFLPKTSLFAESRIGRIRYDKSITNNDSDYAEWSGGIKGKISPRITGILKTGYKTTEYKDTRTTSKKDFKGGSVSGDIDYQLQERSNMNLKIERTLEEATFQTNNYYVINRATGKITHYLFKRLLLIGGGSYNLSKYPEEVTYNSKTDTRKDHIGTGSGGLEYEVKKWLLVLVEYQYKDKNSNFNSFDYTNRIVSGKLFIKF